MTQIRTNLYNVIEQNFPNNTSGAITEPILRTTSMQIFDSAYSQSQLDILSSSNDTLLDFYPSYINSKILEKNAFNLQNEANALRVQSIDWGTHIITLNTNIILPPVASSSFTNASWYLYTPTEPNISQLSKMKIESQSALNSFVFSAIGGDNYFEANFNSGSMIGIKNSFTTYMPLTTTAIAISDSYPDFNVMVNSFPMTLNKISDEYKLMCTVNDGGTRKGMGLSTSTDKINWTDITYIEAITPPSWLSQSNDAEAFNSIAAMPSSNNYNEVTNLYTILYNAKNQTGNYSLSIMTTSDFTSFNADYNQFYCTSHTLENSWFGSYIKYKNKHYIVADRISGMSRADMILYEWTNLDSMELTYVCTIPCMKDIIGSWSVLGNQLPTLFEYNNNLYLSTNGASNESLYLYGNMGNCNGLYIFDPISRMFHEHSYNPYMINPHSDEDWMTNFSYHQSICVIWQEDEKLYCLTSMNHGTNTYSIIPLELRPYSTRQINAWKTQFRDMNPITTYDLLELDIYLDGSTYIFNKNTMGVISIDKINTGDYIITFPFDITSTNFTYTKSAILDITTSESVVYSYYKQTLSGEYALSVQTKDEANQNSDLPVTLKYTYQL